MDKKCCDTIMRVIKRPPNGIALKPPPGIDSLYELGYKEGDYVIVNIKPIEEIEAKSLVQARRTKNRLIKQQEISRPVSIIENTEAGKILDNVEKNKEKDKSKDLLDRILS